MNYESRHGNTRRGNRCQHELCIAYEQQLNRVIRCRHPETTQVNGWNKCTACGQITQSLATVQPKLLCQTV